jgi:hypothetical protein
MSERNSLVPEIARFYGIVIKLYYGDHAPPHFHASYGEFTELFEIESLRTLEGALPRRAHALVLEWARPNQAELHHMWKTQQFHKLPTLE